MKAVISYITKFLIGGEKADVLASLVGYTSDPNKFSRYRVVIIPSPFFRDEVYGTAESMPKLIPTLQSRIHSSPDSRRIR